ncbi:MAG: hypothetical protein ACTHQQ_11540 [Solirubrobacteraceae bacterium]
MPALDLDLGSYRRQTTTSSRSAAALFNRGLIWAYGFNHEAAIDCFEQARAEDPGFALAHWGIAYAVGPNYNKRWDAFDDEDLRLSLGRAHAALVRARELTTGTTPAEAGLIDALARRIPAPAVDGAVPATWDEAYIDAMSALRDAHPTDLDVAALFADALITPTAWQLWDLPTGQPTEGTHVLWAKEVLEAAMRLPGGMEHPGVLHMYVHLMEMSPHPEEALPAADALRDVVPDAGHLVHMPTHIDVLCGDYVRTMRDNARAVAADDRFHEAGNEAEFYTLYRAHNHHFRVYAAMLAGNKQAALESTDQLEDVLPEELLRKEVPPMADWLEGFLAIRVHVLVRFGDWDELAALPLPDDPQLYCTTTAMIHYGRAIAHASLGDIDAADRERELFRASAAAVPEYRTQFNNISIDILAVATAMLDGELEYRRQNYETAFDQLRRAVALDDGLPYDEPWGWMQPTRHALGALLLEQGRTEEAREVYAADLGLDETLPRACQHPGNVWSLHGLHECLVALGEPTAAQIIKQQFDIAAARADVPIEASCLCRLERCC